MHGILETGPETGLVSSHGTEKGHGNEGGQEIAETTHGSGTAAAAAGVSDQRVIPPTDPPPVTKAGRCLAELWGRSRFRGA